MMYAFLAFLLVLFLFVAAAFGALAEAIGMVIGGGIAIVLIVIVGG
jgi:hypothetical protein